jgi:tape measure domain-containing protein
MSGNVIGTATIKIVPDVSQFTPQLTAQLSQALNIVQAQWKQGFEDMEQAVRELIAVVKMEMAEVRQTVEMTSADIANEFNVGMERAETAVQTSGEAIENAIRETGAQAEITGERIERAFAEAGRKSDGHMSRMGGAMGGMLKGGAMAGAAAVGYLATSAFTAGIEMTGSFDKAEASFTALTGSVDDGKKLLDDVKDFAFKTPFDVKQIADQTRNLLAQGQAYGVTKDNVLQYATAIGDAVALTGGGEIEFQRVTRALGQMGSSSKVMAQDMNQLQQSIPGINVWKELGEGLGVTEAEARKMGEAGLIPGAQAANILTEAMREMPGAAGEMERQATTVTGALQNFKEQATSTLTEGMRPFTDALRTFLSSTEAKTAIGQLGAGFGQLLAAMAPIFPVITQLASTFGGFLGTLGKALGPVMEKLGPIFTNLLLRLEGPLTVVAETFGMLLMALMPIMPVLAELIAVGAQLIAEVLVALQPAITAIGDALALVMPMFTTMISQMGAELGPLLAAIANAFVQLVLAIIPILPQLVQLSMAYFPLLIKLIPVLTSFMNFLANIISSYVAPAIKWLADKLAEVGPKFTQAKDKVQELWQKFKDWWNDLKDFPDKVKNKVKDIVDGIKDKLANLDLFQAGKNAIQSLWNGFTSLDLVKKAGEIASGIKDKLGGLLGKLNPFGGLREAGLRAAPVMGESGFATAVASEFSGFAMAGGVNPTAMPVSNARSAGGITFNGPVTFGSDASSSVAELDWMRRTRMGAA